MANEFHYIVQVAITKETKPIFIIEIRERGKRANKNKKTFNKLPKDFEIVK